MRIESQHYIEVMFINTKYFLQGWQISDHGRAESGVGGVNSRGPGILGARKIYLQKKIYTKKKHILYLINFHPTLFWISTVELCLKYRFREMNL